ncbi:MAG: DUF2459 domain-containing protein [Candidatus Kapabacteria bacterium]|jgi:uncharacterized protein (TIGR02117 family)|nr:DUF2459 domain-containing protein [Candidatus Kapabacteria bacterium]
MPSKRRIIVLAGVLLCGMVLALFFIPHRFGLGTTRVGNTAEKPVKISVARYLYHTGIIMPVQAANHDWSEVFPCLRGQRFVEIGWGDRDFYMSGSITVRLAFKALFASESSVLNVNGFREAPDSTGFPTEPFAQKTLTLSAAQYRQMVAWMLASVTIDNNGKAVFLREGFWGVSSGFYEANTAQTGAYSLVNNCNIWNSRALDAADLAVPLWAGIPHPLLWMLPDK